MAFDLNTPLTDTLERVPNTTTLAPNPSGKVVRGKKASDFVNTFQNPFGKTLSGIIDPIDQANGKGTLTYDQANAALTDFNQQWAGFDAASNQWKLQGGDYSTVVDQAYDPNGKFMQTVTGVRSTLQGYVDKLKPAGAPAANAPPAAPTLQTILSGLGLTPQSAADQAADQQRKRALSGGRASTILTGASGLPAAARPQKTLLGY